VSPFWQQLGTSASGKGVSQTIDTKAVFDTSVAADSSGNPVVVYAEYPDANAAQGAIVVKRWNGSAFVTLSASVATGLGYLPQVRLSSTGEIFVAWLTDDVNGNTEIHLRKYDGTSSFVEIGGSDSSGGIVGPAAGVTFPFSLAIGADGNPVVAFLAEAATGIVDVTSPAIVEGTLQVYVRRWNGAAWEFVGSDFSGGGASNAVSFDSPLGSILHSAETPALTLDSTGAPVVAFAYVTDINGGPAPNTDIYVTRWSGTSWDAVGPAVPAADGAIGEGGAGGVSNSDTGSLNPSIAAASGGTLALAWEESSPDGGALYVWVRTWNGSAWVELAGSASGSGFSEVDTQNGVPQIAVGPDDRPVVAWNALTPDSDAAQIFVRRWNGSDAWVEPAPQSASDTGISDAALEALAPALALTPSGGTATAGVPTVTWLDVRQTGPAQVFLRRLFDGATVNLAVTILGNGTVTSDALGLSCAGGACTGDFPAGTALTLTATPAAGGAFMGWAGACAFRGTNPTCPLPSLGVNTSVVATFKRYRVSVVVGTPAGTFGQGTLGTVSGGDISCGPGGSGTCFTDLSQGTPLVLQATPAPGNTFISWAGGPCNGHTDARCQMVVTANSSSTALFRGVTGVRVTKVGTGALTGGTVTGSGIACGAGCLKEIFTGTSVTLTAAPATGATFRGWSGECTNATGSCVFMASGPNRSVVVTNQSVTATFVLNTQKLSVSTAGAGYVVGNAIDCATGNAGHPACVSEYDFGTIIDLTPLPDVDSRLVSWTGCTSLNGSTCRAVLTANLSVKATFGVARTLSVTATGNGTGTITANTAPPLVCSSNCAVSTLVAGNASVILTPAAAVGTTFRWLSDDRCGTSGSAACTIKMDANHSATGQFTLNRQSLRITPRTNGTVVSDPLPGGGLDCGTSTTSCSGVYDFGTPVLLHATADPGAIFMGWTGVTCQPGSASNDCAFLLKANTTATPTFRPRTRVTVSKSGSGTGTVTGPGLSCGTVCSEFEFDARLITLVAAPGVGSRFTGWGGACAFRGMNTSCAFVPAGDNQSVAAAFDLIPLTLSVVSRPSGNVVSVDSLPDNVDCGSGGVGKCMATLNYGTLVRLVATPIPGSRFVGWTGCTTLAGANCSVTLTANRTVTPTYRDVTTVSLTKTGQGTITSIPAGISCGPACASASFDFMRNVVVKLTPAPVIGWDFIGWSGDPSCPGAAPCSFNASTATPIAVAANFSIQLKTLRVTVVGNGSVTGPGGFACDNTSTPCARLFPYGTVETLTPAAAPGFKFTGWSQDCTGAVPTTCKPLMTANHSVTATFKQVFGVTVSTQGNAAPGVIASSPAGVSCGLDCREDFLSGTVVTFTRGAPAAGRTFRWLGDCAFRGSNVSCALTIDANKSVVADYSLQQLGLTINVSGPGTVTGAPGGPCTTLNCVRILDFGVPVLLQAAPSSASPRGEFISWNGCTTTSGTNCSVTLSLNRTIAAVFRPVVTSLDVQATSGDGGLPLAKGGRRQYSAIATFSDASTQDVSASATWSSQNSSVVTVVATSGLVTGMGFGNTSIKAVYKSPGGSTAEDSTAVAADALTANGVTVDCSPFGDPGGPLSCLPSGRSFEVECRATATFAHGGSADVTQQATWSSGNAGIAKFFGLSEFGGQIVASFRIFAGTTFIRATVGAVVSSSNVSPVNRWVVQGTPLALSSLGVAPDHIDFADGTPVPLVATATLQGTTGTAAGCTAPSARDFSLLTSWRTVPSPSPVAKVDVTGVVTPLAPGSVSVRWSFPETLPYTFSSNQSVNPSPGTVRFNGNSSTVTHVYVHEKNRLAVDVSAALDGIAAGDQIRVFEVANPVKSITLMVTGVTDQGTYRDLAVTPISGVNLTNGVSVALDGAFQGTAPITVPIGVP
jgi:uncharacterized repeat protein (TIGR02543 family)